MTLTRDQALEIARRASKAKMTIIDEPFDPHEWVLDAIIDASRLTQPAPANHTPEELPIPPLERPAPKHVLIDLDQELINLLLAARVWAMSDPHFKGWRAFVEWIDRILTTPPATPAVIEAAMQLIKGCILTAPPVTPVVIEEAMQLIKGLIGALGPLTKESHEHVGGALMGIGLAHAMSAGLTVEEALAPFVGLLKNPS